MDRIYTEKDAPSSLPRSHKPAWVEGVNTGYRQGKADALSNIADYARKIGNGTYPERVKKNFEELHKALEQGRVMGASYLAHGLQQNWAMAVSTQRKEQHAWQAQIGSEIINAVSYALNEAGISEGAKKTIQQILVQRLEKLKLTGGTFSNVADRAYLEGFKFAMEQPSDAERQDMNNPKGWEHVKRILWRAYLAGNYNGVPDEVRDQAFEVINRLIASQAEQPQPKFQIGDRVLLVDHPQVTGEITNVRWSDTEPGLEARWVYETSWGQSYLGLGLSQITPQEILSDAIKAEADKNLTEEF